MIVLALVLMAGGLITAVALTLFICEYLFPFLCAGFAGHAALATGGGWPGAIVVSALTFAVVAAGLRLGMVFAKPLPVRALCLLLTIGPAPLVAVALAEACLWPLVPSSAWRMCLAIFAGIWVTVGTCQRLFPLQPAA
jgi:hypothetical protein